MIQIFYVKSDGRMNEKMYKELLAYCSPEKARRIAGIIRFEHRIGHLIGEVLARGIIHEKLGLGNDQIRFGQLEYGKPYLLHRDNFHFNLSHSGDYIVFAVDCNIVGVDVERIRPIDLAVADLVCTEEEIARLSKDDPAHLQKFYSLWTCKESLIKHIGKGFQLPLKQIQIDEQPRLHCEYERSVYYFRQYAPEEDYLISVCTQTENAAFELIPIDLMDLYELITGRLAPLA